MGYLVKEKVFAISKICHCSLSPGVCWNTHTHTHTTLLLLNRVFMLLSLTVRDNEELITITSLLPLKFH